MNILTFIINTIDSKRRWESSTSREEAAVEVAMVLNAASVTIMAVIKAVEAEIDLTQTPATTSKCER